MQWLTCHLYWQNVRSTIRIAVHPPLSPSLSFSLHEVGLVIVHVILDLYPNKPCSTVVACLITKLACSVQRRSAWILLRFWELAKELNMCNVSCAMCPGNQEITELWGLQPTSRTSVTSCHVWWRQDTWCDVMTGSYFGYFQSLFAGLAEHSLPLLNVMSGESGKIEVTHFKHELYPNTSTTGWL